MLNKRTHYKKYGGKTNKQWLFERLIENNEELSNEEIANILTYDVSETSKEQVEVMRARYKAKLKAKIKGSDVYSKAINEIIKEEDIQQKLYKMISKQSENLADTKFKKEEMQVKVFEKLMDVLS